MKKTQEEFIDFLAVIEHRVSETQKAKIDKEGAKFIKTINGYAVYLISSYEASLFYGRNTKWCISSVDTRDYWEQYTENGKIFFFFIKGDIKYCLVGKINYDSDYNEFENGEDEWDDDYINYQTRQYSIWNAEDSKVYTIPGVSDKTIEEFLGIEDTTVYVENMKILRGVLQRVNNTEQKEIIIPDGVTSIGWGACAGFTNLETVKLPESLEFIGDGAFFGCSKLDNISLPPKTEYIAKKLF